MPIALETSGTLATRTDLRYRSVAGDFSRHRSRYTQCEDAAARFRVGGAVVRAAERSRKLIKDSGTHLRCYAIRISGDQLRLPPDPVAKADMPCYCSDHAGD